LVLPGRSCTWKGGSLRPLRPEGGSSLSKKRSPPASFSTSSDLQRSFERSLLIQTPKAVRGSDQRSVVWPSQISEREKAHQDFTRSFDLIQRGKRCQWAIKSRPESKDLPEYSDILRDHRSGDEGGGRKEGRRRASERSKGGASSPFGAEGSDPPS